MAPEKAIERPKQILQSDSESKTIEITRVEPTPEIANVPQSYFENSMGAPGISQDCPGIHLKSSTVEENISQRKSARKSKLVAREDFDPKTIDSKNSEMAKEIESNTIDPEKSDLEVKIEELYMIEKSDPTPRTKKSFDCSLCHKTMFTFSDFKTHLEILHENQLSEIPNSERTKGCLIS